MTNAEQPARLVWRTVEAGHYVAGDPGLTGYTVRRDPNASPDNRWSLRHNGGRVSAHRLLKSAQRAAQTIADTEAPQQVTGEGVHGEQYVPAVSTADPERLMPRQIVDLLACVVYCIGARIDLDWLRATNPSLLPAVDRAVDLGYLSAGLLQITDAGIEHLREQRPASLPTRPGAVEALDNARRVVVIPCGADKAEHPARAREFYTGQQFTLTLRAAEAIAAGGTILVLSARYGLVPLTAMLAPYEQRIDQPGAITPAVLRQQAAALGVLNAGDVTVLAARAYGNAARAVWPHAVNPLDGSAGIGDQRGRLAAMVRSPQPEPVVHGPIDKAAILAKPIDSLLNSGARAPMTVQPEQQHAQADEPTPAAMRTTPAVAIGVFFRGVGAWPTASEVVQRGADLDELHAAEARGEVERYAPYGSPTVFRLPVPDPSRPLAVDDIVTVDPHRVGRQFTVIALDDIDGLLVRVMPRDERDVEDRPRWVSAEYTNRVPAALVVPVEGDDEQPEPQPEPAFVDPWVGTVPAEPAPASIEIAPSGKLDAAGLSVAVCSRGDYRSAPMTSPRARKAGDDHLRAAHGVQVKTIADMLLPAMPGEYTRVLTHLLTPHGFGRPSGIDVVAPDDANPEAFLLHDPSGIAVGAYERHVRLSYPAEHAGEGDGDLGAAYVDLAYGTSFETVADVAVGLVGRLMRRTHADHMHGVADELRDLAEGRHVLNNGLNDYAMVVRPDELRALADRLAPADTECRAAAYARRVTAVLHGVLGVLMDMTADKQPVEHELLRALVLGAAGAVTGPEPSAAGLVEHLAGRGVTAALVADDSAGPADADELLDTLRDAGWREAPETEYVAGKRVRYLTPPAGWQAGIYGGEPQSADSESQTDEPLSPQAAALLAAGGITEPPLTQAQVDAAECGAEFETTARFGTRFHCARPPHGEDAFGHSVMRYPYGTTAPEGPAAAVDAAEGLPAGTTLLSADELVDAGGYLMCGCHGTATEHSCGASAPDTFDPSAEV